MHDVALLGAFAALGSGSPPAADDEGAIQVLVRSARDGDTGAAGQLYDLHVHRLFRAVRPLCVDDAEAEDVAQDTFIKALAALKRYRRRSNARFVSWLLTIGMNTARKRIRRRKRTDVVAPETIDALRDGASAATDPFEALDQSERRQVLLAALAELPERDRTLLTLRYGAELTSAEAARICEVSEANARKICERRRHQLLKRIGSRSVS